MNAVQDQNREWCGECVPDGLVAGALAARCECGGGWRVYVPTVRCVTREMLIDLCESDGTAYWAKSGKVAGEAIEWAPIEPHEFGEDGKEVRKYRATFERLAVALVEVADGQHTNRDTAAECAEALSDGQWIAGNDVSDCVIQVALFGEVVYG